MRVLGLDSSEPDLDSGRVGRERYRWLEERFAIDPEEFKVVAMHHHLVPVPGTGRERNIVHDAGDLLRVLADNGVDLVLCGHKHVPNVWRLEDMLIVNAGTCCTHRLRGKVRPCYNIIEIDDDDHVRVTAARSPTSTPRSSPTSATCTSTSAAGVRDEQVRAAAGCDLRIEEAERVSRVVALIDGEHYPPVVRFALAELAREHEVVARRVRRRDREGRSRPGAATPTACRS